MDLSQPIPALSTPKRVGCPTVAGCVTQLTENGENVTNEILILIKASSEAKAYKTEKNSPYYRAHTCAQKFPCEHLREPRGPFSS